MPLFTCINPLAAMGHDRGSSEGLFFEKRRVFPSGFTFNVASPCENTDAVDSDFGMSTSEEKIDSFWWWW